MRRGNERVEREDSFTSVTSISTESSEEVLDSNKRQSSKTFFWAMQYMMGQKNTRENKTGSRPGSETNTPKSAKKEKLRGNELPGENEQEFVEVLESDGEAETSASRDKMEKKSPPLKFKLSSLSPVSVSKKNFEAGKERQSMEARIKRIRDSIKGNLAVASSFRPDSDDEDDYDQPEEVESIRKVSRKVALLNWGRFTTKLLRDNEHVDGIPDNESEQRLRAIKNWKVLVEKLDNNADSFVSSVLKQKLEKEEGESDDGDMRRPVEDELQPRAVNNWQSLVSKVTEKTKLTTSLKKIIESKRLDDGDASERMTQIGNERALENWRKVVSGLLEKAEGNCFNSKLLLDNLDRLKQGSVEGDSSGDESEATLSQSRNRAIENWRQILNKLRFNFKRDITQLLDEMKMAAADEAIAEKCESEAADENETDEDKDDVRIEILRRWEKVVCKLLEKYEDKSLDFGRVAEEYFCQGKYSIQTPEGAESIDERSSDESTRPIQNWEMLTMKMLLKNEGESRSLKSVSNRIRNHSQDVDDEVDSESSDESAIVRLSQSVVMRWEVLVKKYLKNRANENYGRYFVDDSVQKRRKHSEVEDMAASKATRRWQRLGEKLLERTRSDVSTIFSHVAKEIEITLKKGNDEENINANEREPTVGRGIETSKIALNNWRGLTMKILEGRKDEPQNVRENLAARLRAQKTKMFDEGEEKTQKSERALSNWTKLTGRILEASKVKTPNIRQNLAGILREQSRDGPSEGRENGRNIERVLRNWTKLTKEILAADKDATPIVRQTLAERFLKKEAENKNEVKQDRALKNWQKLSDKIKGMNTGKKTVYQVLKENTEINEMRDEENRKGGSDDNSTSNEGSKAMQNWRKVLSKSLMKVRENETIPFWRANFEGLEYDVCYECKNMYEFPILLSCSHTFCRDCITKLIDESDGIAFECPLCKGKSVLSDGEEELFCPNFLILKKMQEERCGNDGCQNCGRDIKSELVCQQCADRLCKECAEIHVKYDKHKHHTLSRIGSIENIENLQKKYYCLKHQGEELSSYCLDCDLSICPKCAKKKHRGHDNHDCGAVSEAAMAGRRIIVDAAKRLEGEHDFESEIEKIERMQQGVDAELAEMQEEIKSSIEKIITKLRMREAQLYRDVKEKHRITYDALAERRQNLEAAMLQKESLGNLLKDLHEHKNDVEMLQMQATISDRMSEILDLKTSESMEVDYDFVFDPKDEKIEREIGKLGRIDVRDRRSGREIYLDGFDRDLSLEEYAKGNKKNTRHDETDRNDIPQQTWSPTTEVNVGRTSKELSSGGRVPGKEDGMQRHKQKPKQRSHHHKSMQQSNDDVLRRAGTKATSDELAVDYEEIKSGTYVFEGSRTPPCDSFSQLITERGERVNVLKYGVKDYKNNTCDVQMRIICPDKSIVSAHVAENADGVFTVFLCPEVKRDFNCFITIGGKHFKQEYKILNLYGDFQGMKSKEIDLACRAMSLLRWHITPGLLEAKNGKVRRSKKFFRIVGTSK